MDDAVKLKRAVEWKIFETQAVLISDEAQSGHLDIAKKWFQPHHYRDVVDERFTGGRCGFPLCVSNPGARANIKQLYSEKKLYHDPDIAQKYCSTACIERSQIFSNTLDESSPLTRKHVSTLAPVEEQSEIDSVLEALSVVDRTDSRTGMDGMSPPSGIRGAEGPVLVPGARRVRVTTSSTGGTNGSFLSPNKHTRHPNGDEVKLANQAPPTFHVVENKSAGSDWIQATSPDKSSLRDIDTHLHSLYTPSLLSYDPVHTVPPKHTPLASTAYSLAEQKIEGIDRRPAATSGTQMHDGSSPSGVVTGILKASSATDLTLQDVSDTSSSPTRSPQRMFVKKSLSFGEDTVRVFKRGSKATALYTEQDLLEGRIPSNYSRENSDSDSNSPPNPKITHRYTTGSTEMLRRAVEKSVVPSPSQAEDRRSSVDSDDTDSSDLDVTPPFENQVRDWLSGGWDHGEGNGRWDAKSDGKCSVNKSLSKTYTPNPHIEPVGWVEPAPPPPKERGLSAAEGTKVVNEYKRLRRKNQRESRAAASSEPQQAAPTGRKPARPPVKKRDGPVPLGSLVVERDWRGGTDPVAPLPAPATSAIEGYEPRHMSESKSMSASAPPAVPDGGGTDMEGDSDGGEDEASLSVRVAPESMLRGLSFNPFAPAGGTEGYSEAQRMEDEKILKEIAAEVGGVAGGHHEEEDDEGMDNVTKQNFFSDMWMALEDMFGFNTISWLNGVENPEADAETTDLRPGGSIEDDEDDAGNGDDEREHRHGYALHAHTMNSRSSILALVQRGLSAAEKTVNIATVVSCHPAMLAKYNECKTRLLSSARVASANPSFTSQQWAFFGLLLIDAVLNKRVFVEAHDVAAACVAKDNWNAKYVAFAAGLLGGAEGVRGVLTDREFTILRQFFDVEEE